MKVENTTTYWNAQFEKEYKEFMKMVQRKKIMDIEKIRWAHERFYYMAYYIPMKSKVLEIACGLGHFCRFLRARNVWMDITGIDFSTTAIRYAQRLDADNKYLVANAYKLPFADNEFDCLVAGEVIEHLHKPAKAVKEWCRVVRPGGQLVITTPILDSPSNPHSEEHIKEYTMPEFSEFCLKYLKETRLEAPTIKVNPRNNRTMYPYWMMIVGEPKK